MIIPNILPYGIRFSGCPSFIGMLSSVACGHHYGTPTLWLSVVQSELDRHFVGSGGEEGLTILVHLRGNLGRRCYEWVFLILYAALRVRLVIDRM